MSDRIRMITTSKIEGEGVQEYLDALTEVVNKNIQDMSEEEYRALTDPDSPGISVTYVGVGPDGETTFTREKIQ